MNNQTNDNPSALYRSSILEFVATGAKFCSFLENEQSESKRLFYEKMTLLLPILYVQASALLQEVQGEDEPMQFEEIPAEIFVKEEDYMYIENKISSLLGEDDLFLETQLNDMKYSETPIASSISENIADIYQDIRNFISVYQHRIENQMHQATRNCLDNFVEYWGQNLVNVLRPIHMSLYDSNNENELYDE